MQQRIRKEYTILDLKQIRWEVMCRTQPTSKVQMSLVVMCYDRHYKGSLANTLARGGGGGIDDPTILRSLRRRFFIFSVFTSPQQ
jgi:hypothetical protein